MVKIISCLEDEALVAGIREVVPDAEISFISPDDPVPDNLTGNLQADCLIGVASQLNQIADIIAKIEGLQWIHVLGTGISGFPLESVGDRLLTTSRGANAVPVAEWAFAMIIAARKNLPAHWINEPPPYWGLGENIGTLKGQKLAIYGFGAIGQKLAKMALAFEMEISVMTRQSAPDMEGVRGVDNLQALLTDADHVVLAAPATAATHHVINKDSMALMKPGAHLVNVARGELVNEADLRDALDSGHIARASLDVAEDEPLPAGHWFYTHEKVLFSPHLAWFDESVLQTILTSFLENLARFAKQETLENLVDMSAGY